MKDYWSEEVKPYLPKRDYWAEEVAPFLEEEEELGLLEKWRKFTEPTPIAGAKPYSVEEAKILVGNIGKQALALPRFPIDIAQQVVKEPLETGKQLAQYPFNVFGDYMIYISPLSTLEQRRGAIERIAEDPLGLFFAVGITKGGIRGAHMLKGAVKRTMKKKGKIVEEPPAEKVPAITEEQIAKEAPEVFKKEPLIREREFAKEKGKPSMFEKEPVPGEVELKLARELKEKGVTEKAVKEPWEMTKGEWQEQHTEGRWTIVGSRVRGTAMAKSDIDFFTSLTAKEVKQIFTRDRIGTSTKHPEALPAEILEKWKEVRGSPGNPKTGDVLVGVPTVEGRLDVLHLTGTIENPKLRQVGYPRGLVEGEPRGAVPVSQRVAADFDPQSIPLVWHRRIVEQARARGEKIPPEVLAEYPDLVKPKVTAKPAEIPADAGPGIMGGVSSVGQEASVQRVMGALKEAKPLRKEQEALYTKERGARLAKSLAIREKTTGEAGFYAEKGQFTGEMAKVTFESIRSKVSQTDIGNLFNKVRDSGFLTEFEKMPAREGLIRMFGEHGGRVPTEGQLRLLEQVFPPEFMKTVMAKRPLWEKFKEAGWQLANIPRSVMASFDLSFGLRQGAFAAPRYRGQFWDSWKKQFKIFGSEKAYQASREALTKHPDFMLAKQSKVSFTELGKIMTQREESFMSQWAEKIPVVGKGIRASSRAYTSFANKFRLDIFSRMVKDAEGMGFNPRKNPYLAGRIGDFVNNGTGRGHLGSFERSAVALNAIFFSPRLNMARMKLLNPVYYIKQPKFVRTEALKTVLTASGTAVTILTLADLMGAEAGVNPLSADFGKIKIGNTRIDMLAGFGQFMRAGAQIIMGKTISTTTGKETILGEGYKPRTRLDILLQQVEYKESPIASFATTLLKGKDFAGRDVSIPKEVGRRFVPMVVADMVELAKEDPRLLPLGIPAVFGVGLQTYAHPYAKLVEIEKEHGYGIKWQQAKKELESSGFKFNIKAYKEYKRGK